MQLGPLTDVMAYGRSRLKDNSSASLISLLPQPFCTNGRTVSIVLLDMSMPELDGVGAAKEIRRIESTTLNSKSARILALTGMSTPEDKRRAFEAGVDG